MKRIILVCFTPPQKGLVQMCCLDIADYFSTFYPHKRPSPDLPLEIVDYFGIFYSSELPISTSATYLPKDTVKIRLISLVSDRRSLIRAS